VTNGDKLNLLIGLCAFILVFLLWPEKQRRHKKQTSADGAEAHSARAYHIKQRILMFFGKPNHWYPDDSGHQTTERKYWRRQFWVSWATLVFLIFGSGIAYKAFREAQRQAQAAEDQLRSSVSLNEIAIVDLDPAVGLIPRWENTGGVPAQVKITLNYRFANSIRTFPNGFFLRPGNGPPMEFTLSPKEKTRYLWEASESLFRRSCQTRIYTRRCLGRS
jgi:hypothetical protein